MKVENIHSRTVPIPADQVGVLMDSLSSERDLLWPDDWPPMRFDRPLQVGATGGHKPIRYFVEAFRPGRRIRFQFTGPAGFNGYHQFDILEDGPEQSTLKHSLIMTTSGGAIITWPLFFRPLHDALVEEAFDKAERHFNLNPVGHRRSPYVRFLRKLFKLLRKRKRSKMRPQERPQ